MTMLVALHMYGIPEAAMLVGPLVLIGVFVKLARRGDAQAAADEDDE